VAKSGFITFQDHLTILRCFHVVSHILDHIEREYIMGQTQSRILILTDFVDLNIQHLHKLSYN